MARMKLIFRVALALVLVAAAVAVYVEYYPFLFSRRVKGVIESVERIHLDVALMQSSSDQVNPQLFSFSVAVREPSGEIVTASAEDRQWAVAQKGFCVEAVFYPYPWWHVMKSGTFYNARLDKMYDCSVPSGDAGQ